MGCHCGKASGVAAPAGGGPTILFSQETAAEGARQALVLSVLRVEGIRAADAVFVEVEVEGQPGSKVKTRTGAASAKTLGEGEHAKQIVEADIRSTLTFKAYPEGAGLILTVRDADLASTQPLGTVTIPGLMVQTKFIGKVPLTGAGEGYEASLEVSIGERHILVEAAQEITNVVSDTVDRLTEIVAEAKEDVNETVAEATMGIEDGAAHLDMDEVKQSVDLATAEVKEIAKDATQEAKGTVKDGAAEIKNVMVDVVEEVKETDGAVCCKC